MTYIKLTSDEIYEFCYPIRKYKMIFWRSIAVTLVPRNIHRDTLWSTAGTLWVRNITPCECSLIRHYNPKCEHKCPKARKGITKIINQKIIFCAIKSLSSFPISVTYIWLCHCTTYKFTFYFRTLGTGRISSGRMQIRSFILQSIHIRVRFLHLYFKDVHVYTNLYCNAMMVLH